jgi:GH18 family chitinase
MQKWIAIVLFGLAFSLDVVHARSADGEDEVREVRVAGYVPDYRFPEFDVESLHGLTDVILFSAEPNADGSLNMGRLEKVPWESLLAFKTKRRVRLLVSIGGWERSTHFPEVATREEARKRFVTDILRTALDKRLDGIDLDWEHPRNAVEEEAYGHLLADLRRAFAPHGLQLTVTIGPWQRLPAVAIEAVDAVQLMSYDHDHEHATTEDARRDVQAFLDAGIPRRKIILGLPFYGRHVESREATAYRDLVRDFSPDPETDRVGQISFNGPKTIRRKFEFAMEAGLGGVMVWELGQDAAGETSLLQAIREAVSGRNP